MINQRPRTRRAPEAQRGTKFKKIIPDFIPDRPSPSVSLQLLWQSPRGVAVSSARRAPSLRADRVDPFLTLLWHPQMDEAIGVKIKGFRVLFQCLQEVAESLGKKLDDAHFLPLVSALEMAMTAGLGAVITTEAERERMAEIKAKYQKARHLITRAQATFDTRELAKAA